MLFVGFIHWVVLLLCALLLDDKSSCCHAFVVGHMHNMVHKKSRQSSDVLMMASENGDAEKNVRMFTDKLVTASGKPVCRYALAAAARSSQSEYIPLKYRDMLQNADVERGAPFYFYYNPHRYPQFLSGVSQSFDDPTTRSDIFFASGGTERSPAALDQRLNDALAFCGGDYLDGFVLEYVCPDELDSDTQLGKELQNAIDHVRSYVQENKVRYVMASTHSHRVGRALARSASLDAMMLRYNLSHRKAAEISFPETLDNDIPVIAFTTTRWNTLQRTASPAVTTADCITFALQHPAVEVVLHSARDEVELDDALLPMIACTDDSSRWMSESKYSDLCAYYSGDEMAWNDDGFDEYPDESI